jgi:thiosulfate/3-mercaptopyruvate sulfurtransferase
MKKLGLFLFGLIISTAMFAQDIISADDLAKDLRNQNLVIISAGPKTEYDKQHITGSISLPYNTFDKAGNIEGLLIADSEMAKILGDRGVSEKNTIVVYDEFDGRYAARVYFLLKYLGAKDVKILDGNLDAWRAGRKPITRNPTTVTKTTFTPSVNRRIMLSTQEVSGNRPNSVLVDSRAPGEFQGRERDSKGYIPGAINIEYKELLEANGKLKAKAALERIYASKGITKDKEVIIYCTTGVRAGLHYLVLTSFLGYTNVKVYDAGYNEWVSVNPGRIAK